MRALITGVGGFAGPHLVQRLVASTDWTLYGTQRQAAPTGAHGYTAVSLDLLDREQVQATIAEIAPDYVFHLAAQSHVPTSHHDHGATLMNNIIGQTHLLDACRTLAALPRVLIVASGEEYGLATPAEMPLREDNPLRPTSPYAVSKVAQDYLGLQYFLAYGLPVIRVRAFNHIGPGQSDRFVISAFARQIAEIEAGRCAPVVRVGNLEAQRDFLDVRDVVQAYYLALIRGEPGAVYNIGSGVAVSISDALNQLLALSHATITVETDPERLRPADVPLIVADTTRLRTTTGWAPSIPFTDSLCDVLNWWREQLGVPVMTPSNDDRDGPGGREEVRVNVR